MTLLKTVRRLRHIIIPPGAPRLNALAVLIGVLALGVLYVAFRATPAGGGLDHSAIPQLNASGSPISSGADGRNEALTLSPDELNHQIRRAVHGSLVALKLHVALLDLGRHRISALPDYTATFVKQERVDGALQDLQTLQLKLRHKPFSVYMKWLAGGDVGRQVLFVQGENDDQLQVRLGGIKSRLPVMHLEPTSARAMQESRHPITEMGLLRLASHVHKYRSRDCSLQRGVRWEMLPDQKHFDRDCDCWIVEYDGPEVEPIYRKMITCVDKELALPISVRNYGWPDEGVETSDAAALDEATLIEYYGYTEIRFETQLSDADFEKLRR
ncbi:MAG: DUF1571 domain-containing protein [Deltaproteobacteria bacterium]